MNRRQKIELGILLTIVGIAYATIIAFTIKSETKCNKHVLFMDGSKLDATRVCSYRDNTTHIKTCSGNKIIVPTIRIKEITRD